MAEQAPELPKASSEPEGSASTTSQSAPVDDKAKVKGPACLPMIAMKNNTKAIHGASIECND